VSECYRASDLKNSGKGIMDCLPALVHLVKSETNAAFGFDFPFGLPSSLVSENNWEEFVLAFPTRFNDPDDFKAKCFSDAGKRELLRQTDFEAHTPFSPYNLRLCKQSYYGISKVLFPLVRDGSACVLPFHKPVAGKPWLLEVCPASTLKNLMKNQVPSYKGPKEDQRENRRQILVNVMKAGVVFGKNAEIKDRIISNMGGDALDSVIACLTVFKTLQKRPVAFQVNPVHMIEGQVYWRV